MNVVDRAISPVPALLIAVNSDTKGAAEDGLTASPPGGVTVPVEPQVNGLSTVYSIL